jgi:hypothetical protein
MGWIVVHRIEPLSDGVTALIILKCVGCTPEHRINFNMPIPRWGEDRKVSERLGTALRREHVRIMAAGGCKAAVDESGQVSRPDGGSGG